MGRITSLCQVIATSLPPEEIEGIRQMFQEMDHDGSGNISFEELREGEHGNTRGTAVAARSKATDAPWGALRDRSLPVQSSCEPWARQSTHAAGAQVSACAGCCCRPVAIGAVNTCVAICRPSPQGCAHRRQ